MKNIHVLSTDKPSRLQLQMNGNFHIENGQTIALRSYQNIYITSDEEIKEGDYVTNGKYLSQAMNEWWTKFYIGNPNLKADYWKIILTTDQDLIKDGVQEIDDEFLEWFVKNPSCEEVDVKKESHIKIEEVSYKGDFQNVEYINYKIIIPKEELSTKLHIGEVVDESYPEKFRKEEHKKETFEDYLQRLKDRRTEDNYKYTDEDFKNYIHYIFDCYEKNLSVYKCLEFMYLTEKYMDDQLVNREPKQETLEEVKKVERTELFNSIYSVVKKIPRKEVEGDVIDAPSCAYELEQLFLKWQQERSYSEAIDLFITEIKTEFKDDNWDYLEFI